MLTLTVWSQAECLDWLNKRLVLMSHCSCLEEVPNLVGWLSGVWTQTDDLSENSGASVRPPPLGVGMRAVPRLCIELCTGIYLTTEENHGKTSDRAAEKCLANHCRARFLWSIWPPTSGGLDSSAGTRSSRFTLRATGPTLGQSKYLPSWRTKGFSASANLESKLQLGLWCGRRKKEHPNHRESVCY